MVRQNLERLSRRIFPTGISTRCALEILRSSWSLGTPRQEPQLRRTRKAAPSPETPRKPKGAQERSTFEPPHCDAGSEQLHASCRPRFPRRPYEESPSAPSPANQQIDRPSGLSRDERSYR